MRVDCTSTSSERNVSSAAGNLDPIAERPFGDAGRGRGRDEVGRQVGVGGDVIGRVCVVRQNDVVPAGQGAARGGGDAHLGQQTAQCDGAYGSPVQDRV